MKTPRVFFLVRDTDVSGVSGTGKVAEGIVFSNGKVALAWCVKIPSVTIYGSIEECIEIHGHGGCTRVEYQD